MAGKGLVDKVGVFRKVISQNGGFLQSFLKLFRTDELKWGTLVGEDKYGNKYYENKYYFVGRSRWVEFPSKVGWDYDGSQVPAEWHTWLHYMSDKTPIEAPPPPYKFIIDHKQNFTGTDKAYVPYSTTRPKIEAWKPPQK